jgi:pimeloyl-ACP methyl ester carboxylesterase
MVSGPPATDHADPPFREKGIDMNGDTSVRLGDTTFLLVHGSWHLGSAWSGVARHLREAGYGVAAPTLAGHGTRCERHVTHEDYLDSVLDALERIDGPVALVGHSFGGSVISRVAARRPDRCELLVYYSAFVPRDGESVADSLPEPFAAFLRDAASGRDDGSAPLPGELFAASFANTVDASTAAALHAQLVPEPVGPVFEPLSITAAHELGIPTAYVSCRQDAALPPGSFHPGQSSRLVDPRLIEIDADHEALLTAPQALAWALLEAVGASTRALAKS